jgi:hypothetical protein
MPTAPTPRQQLAAWMRARIADMDEVILPDLARAAVDSLSADDAFLRAWFADTGYPVAYTIGAQIAADTRTAVVDEDAAAAARTERKPRANWFSRLEHHDGKYTRLGDMTRPQLLSMADERETGAVAELRFVGLARRLAAALPDDHTPVRAQFSEEQIDRWDRLTEVKWAAKLSTPPPPKPMPKPAEDAATD